MGRKCSRLTQRSQRRETEIGCNKMSLVSCVVVPRERCVHRHTNALMGIFLCGANVERGFTIGSNVFSRPEFLLLMVILKDQVLLDLIECEIIAQSFLHENRSPNEQVSLCRTLGLSSASLTLSHFALVCVWGG